MNHPYLIFLGLAFLFPATLCVAQPTFRNWDIVDAIDIINMRHSYDAERSDIDGTPYLRDTFDLGKIIYTNETAIKHIPLRYNIYKDRIEYVQEDKVIELLKQSPVSEIFIGEENFVYHSNPTGKKGHRGYFHRLIKGRVSLLAKYNVTFRKAAAAKPMVSAQKARFERGASIYLLEFNDGSLEKISSIKKLIASLINHQDKLKAFAKREKISVGKSEELQQLIHYFNQLEME